MNTVKVTSMLTSVLFILSWATLQQKCTERCDVDCTLTSSTSRMVVCGKIKLLVPVCNALQRLIRVRCCVWYYITTTTPLGNVGNKIFPKLSDSWEGSSFKRILIGTNVCMSKRHAGSFGEHQYWCLTLYDKIALLTWLFPMMKTIHWNYSIARFTQLKSGTFIIFKSTFLFTHLKIEIRLIHETLYQKIKQPRQQSKNKIDDDQSVQTACETAIRISVCYSGIRASYQPPSYLNHYGQ